MKTIISGIVVETPTELSKEQIQGIFDILKNYDFEYAYIDDWQTYKKAEASNSYITQSLFHKYNVTSFYRA